MDTITTKATGQVACQFDLGDGRAFDIEFEPGRDLWATSGPGIPAVDVWLKEVVASIDLRIRITRTSSGIDVSVDRGRQQGPWWPADDCPKLIVGIDPATRIASVSAQAGHGEDRRLALLGSILLTK